MMHVHHMCIFVCVCEYTCVYVLDMGWAANQTIHCLTRRFLCFVNPSLFLKLLTIIDKNVPDMHTLAS